MIPFTMLHGGRTVASFHANETAARDHANQAAADPRYALAVYVASQEIRANDFASSGTRRLVYPTDQLAPPAHFLVLTVERPVEP